jgi:glutamyl-tRNA synthetase
MQATLNAALAIKTGGVFILRIEDTDRARIVPGAEAAIFEALEWLGTPPDESPARQGPYGPYRQSERLPLYRLAAEHLLDAGRAYRCFCSPERLETVRQEQMKAGANPRYDRHCLSLAPAEVQARLRAGDRNVIRFRAPEGAPISFMDEVRGAISFDASMVDDPIILKADGYPTYHLAALVDDHFMRVTTVIRGEEWISSTPKHIALYKAFGWETPKFLHTVILRDAQRRKLSKRSGDTSMHWFRSHGYLPEGFRNFLTRLLWPHPEEKDLYPFEEFIRLFNVRDLPRTGPVVDLKLLDFINGHYLSLRTPEETRRSFVLYLEELEKNAQDEAGVSPISKVDMAALRHEISADAAYAEKAFGIEPERNRKLADIFANNGFFFAAAFTPAPRELLLKYAPEAEQAASILRAVLKLYIPSPAGHIPGEPPFTMGHEEWETAMRRIASDFEVKPKTVFMLARLALTGTEKTPPLHDVSLILGPERTQKRLAHALTVLESA